MKICPKQAAGAALLIVTQLLLTSHSSASTLRNGEYEGEMRCGAHITSPDRGPFVQPVRISVTGNTVSWSRAVDGFVEVGQGSINQDKLEMSLRGKWLKEIPQNDGWTTLVKLRYDGRSLDGTGTILSNDGRQRFRDCDVHIAVLQQSVQSALAQQPQSGGRVQQASPSLSVDERTDEILKELSGQGTSNTSNAQVGKPAAASRVVGANQGQNDADMRKSAEVPQKSLANEVGPLFSRKSELLEMARNGRFLTERQGVLGDNNNAFAESIRAVLFNDYGIMNYPTSNYSRDGVVVKRIEAGCKLEIEDSVRELFGKVQASQLAVIGDLSANPVGVPTFTREVEVAISNFHDRNKSGSWCSKVGPHPYVAALPRILQEFASSNRIAVEAARSRSRQQAEKAKAEQLLREQQQAEEIRRASLEREAQQKAKAESEKKSAEARLEYERGAASRNAQKIRAIGFPNSLLSSKIKLFNMFGNWVDYMPFDQWVGLLLENKSIESIQSYTNGGRPGLMIKRVGNPSFGFLFRVESHEAYVDALVGNGTSTPVRTPADVNQVGGIIQTLARP